MITVLAGLPGRFTRACRDLCITAFESAGKRCTPIELATAQNPTIDLLSTFAQETLKREPENTLLTTQSLDRGAVQILTELGRPVLVTYEDPIQAVYALVADGYDVNSAVRAVLMSCAGLEEIASSGIAVCLFPEQAEENPLTFAKAFEPALRAEVDVADVSRIFDSYSAQLASVQARELPDVDRLTLQAALRDYSIKRMVGEPVETIIATRNLFFLPEPPGAGVPAKLDLTGRARCLAYGPYINLPIGTWSVRLHCAFSAELNGLPFTMDAVASRKGIQREVARTSFTAVPGKYAAQIYIESTDPDALYEFRLFVDSAVFDGTLALGYVEMVRTKLVDVGGLEALFGPAGVSTGPSSAV